MELSVPVLAILQRCATTQERPDYSPPAEGDRRQVPPSRCCAYNLLTQSVSEHKPKPKKTHCYFRQKIFPPLVHRDSLVIGFALTQGAYCMSGGANVNQTGSVRTDA